MPGYLNRFSCILLKSQLQVLLRGMGFDVELTPAYATWCCDLWMWLAYCRDFLMEFPPNFPFRAACKEEPYWWDWLCLPGILGRVVVLTHAWRRIVGCFGMVVVGRFGSRWAVSRFAWMLGSTESGVLQFKAQMLDEIEWKKMRLSEDRSRVIRGPPNHFPICTPITLNLCAAKNFTWSWWGWPGLF